MIYFTGDTHGEQDRLSRSALSGLKKGDWLVVCGDFGFLWKNDRRERKFLNKLARRKYSICFVDGTHENFDAIVTYPLVLLGGGNAHRIRGNVYHLLRGQVYQLDGKTLFTFGGGESPESLMLEDDELSARRPEVPTRAEMHEGIRNLERYGYKVDFIATHEPPAAVRDFLLLSQTQTSRISAIGSYLDELMREAEYGKWFFGSLHTDKHVSASMTSVFERVIPGWRS